MQDGRSIARTLMTTTSRENGKIDLDRVSRVSNPLQAWDKGRRLAQSVSLSGPWPGEATVPSRSSAEPRKVDLVNGRPWPGKKAQP